LNALSEPSVASATPSNNNAHGDTAPVSLEIIGVSKRFGDLQALTDVSLRLMRGTVHALLGENGAGKSTLVKCVMGYQSPDEGSVVVDERERTIRSTRDAHALGLGMVYQHFTLVPAMTVLENLVLARDEIPAFVDWAAERRQLEAESKELPFAVELDRPVITLAAGEKQKVEILKQLYLRRRILILDEPSSVLTPVEADEVLETLRQRAVRDGLAVLLITHKLREVTGFADDVTVLRGGRRVASAKAQEHSPDSLASLMMGEDQAQDSGAGGTRTAPGSVRLQIRDLEVLGDRGTHALRDLSLSVASGEILGIAGVSGNGQRELVETLNGQRRQVDGEVSVNGRHFGATREDMEREGFRCLPEEPLRNACVPSMSVAENMALRRFDDPSMTVGRWLLNRRAHRHLAQEYVAAYQVRTQSVDTPLRLLSGGNIQRAVLARELADEPGLIVAANPCFGLDFAAAREIRMRLVEARNRGAAILLLSEDLDEVMTVADRIGVLFAGQIVDEFNAADADRGVIGRRMAGE